MKDGGLIFSGEDSRDLRAVINNADSIKDLQDILYLICCRLQELESLCLRLAERNKEIRKVTLENS